MRAPPPRPSAVAAAPASRRRCFSLRWGAIRSYSAPSTASTSTPRPYRPGLPPQQLSDKIVMRGPLTGRNPPCGHLLLRVPQLQAPDVVRRKESAEAIQRNGALDGVRKMAPGCLASSRLYKDLRHNPSRTAVTAFTPSSVGRTYQTTMKSPHRP